MKFVIATLLGCLLVSCGSQNLAPAASPAYSSAESSGRGSMKSVERKLIKNGSMTLESVDVKKATKGAEEILKEHGGFVENKVEGKDVTLAARIPAKNLIVGMDDLKNLGKVTSRRVRVTDVTEQYIDVDAQIRNLRVLRNRLKKLYSRSNNVEELLKVEAELARVQTELDSLEGRMKAMKKNIAYSQLSISINRKRIPGPLGAVSKSIDWLGKKLWVLN